MLCRCILALSGSPSRICRAVSAATSGKTGRSLRADPIASVDGDDRIALLKRSNYIDSYSHLLSQGDDMRIASVKISNFRGIKTANLLLPAHAVIIGDN